LRRREEPFVNTGKTCCFVPFPSIGAIVTAIGRVGPDEHRDLLARASGTGYMSMSVPDVICVAGHPGRHLPYVPAVDVARVCHQ
jgi:hypothetical protein